MKVWSATQSLSLEIVRQLPPEGIKWVFLRAEVKVLKDGNSVAQVMLLDETMSLVASGQCVHLIVPSAQTKVQVDKRTTEGARCFKV